MFDTLSALLSRMHMVPDVHTILLGSCNGGIMQISCSCINFVAMLPIIIIAVMIQMLFCIMMVMMTYDVDDNDNDNDRQNVVGLFVYTNAWNAWCIVLYMPNLNI